MTSGYDFAVRTSGKTSGRELRARASGRFGLQGYGVLEPAGDGAAVALGGGEHPFGGLALEAGVELRITGAAGEARRIRQHAAAIGDEHEDVDLLAADGTGTVARRQDEAARARRN